MLIKEAILLAARRENLSYQTAEAVMHEIMEGKASEIQMAAFLTAMSVKGETIEEITGSAAGMRVFTLARGIITLIEAILTKLLKIIPEQSV